MYNWQAISKKLQELFKIKTYPIGFKRFEDADAIDAIEGLRRPEHDVSVCMLFSQSRRWGHTIGTKRTDRKVLTYCAMIHGLMKVPPKMLEVPPPGTEMPDYLARWVAGWDDHFKRTNSLPRLPMGEAILVAPLQSITVEPDVVLIYADPAQVMLMIQSMEKIEFERYQFGCVGESSCSDYLVDCYLTGKPKVGLPGYGERSLGHVADEEIVLALPPAYVPRVIEGYEKLRDAGVVYPVALAGLDCGADILQMYARPARLT